MWYNLSTRLRRSYQLAADRRASISVLAAVAIPVCLGVMALGIDVSYWEVKRIELQRLADIAALGGAVRYSQTNDPSAAVTTAANVAEVNGVPAGTRSTSGSTTLTDNSSGWVTSYTLDANAGTLTAQIQASAPIWFGRLYTTATDIPISAKAVAQVTTTNGGHPCILALKGDTTGVTTYVDLTISGNTSISSQACGIRSDGGLSISGSSSISVSSVIASGSISINGGGQITCSTSASCSQSGAPQIPDPFYSTYWNQLSAPSNTTVGSNTGSTYNPGVYSSNLSFSGNGGSKTTYTLNPGVYYVQGSISITGGVTLTGSGVTLISTGGINVASNAYVSLTAPSTGPTAGLLFGTATTQAVSLTGSSNNVLTGAVYAPNSDVTITGDSGTAASPSNCFNVVGSTVTFTGNSRFTNSGCGSLNVPTLYNSPLLTKLIQ